MISIENILVMMFFDIDCSFYDRSSPIYTQPRYLPPSKMLDADITDSVIGEGCVIKVNFF
jgi:ADP-glucose pyrophosphorylase